MEQKYFLIIDGVQSGPLGYNELRSAGITPDTPVWRTGLDNWVKASTLPELTPLFQPYSEQPYYSQQPYSQQPYGQRPMYTRTAPNGLPIAHTNWMTWAIVGTILGFLCCMIGMIFGIIGIVNANKANRFYNEGNATLGDSANSTARTMTIISLVFGALGIPASIYILTTSFSSILGSL